jgi:hypothetical protein
MIADADSILAVKVLARMGSVMPMQNVGINRLMKSTTGSRNGESASPLHLK